MNAVGGPDRPPSKRMIEQMRLEEQEMRQNAREERRQQHAQASQNNQGRYYWDDLQHNMQERTERLGITGESMNRLEENSSNFVDDVNKFISTQKRKATLGSKSTVTLL